MMIKVVNVQLELAIMIDNKISSTARHKCLNYVVKL